MKLVAQLTVPYLQVCQLESQLCAVLVVLMHSMFRTGLSEQSNCRCFKPIGPPCLLQEVLELVRTSAADFDAVCMATALHKMASLDADPQQYKLLGDRPELMRLKDMICELLTFRHQIAVPLNAYKGLTLAALSCIWSHHAPRARANL